MSVSKEYIADLVATLDANRKAEDLRQIELAKQLELDIIAGMCPKCYEFDYCHWSCE